MKQGSPAVYSSLLLESREHLISSFELMTSSVNNIIKFN